MTNELRQRTREYFRDNALTCIEEARAGVFHVNDIEAYCKSRAEDIEAVMRGDWDGSFAFLQLAKWLESRECPPLLP